MVNKKSFTFPKFFSKGTITFKEFLVYQSVMSPSSDVVDVEEMIKRKKKKIDLPLSHV